VPLNAVLDSIDVARENGMKATKTANKIADSSFAEISKEWIFEGTLGGDLPQLTGLLCKSKAPGSCSVLRFELFHFLQQPLER
jgi:hypothetical protein